jgi:hypothetical protein
VRIQLRSVIENLDALAERLVAICRNDVEPLDTRGRSSAAWGQPWLTSYIKWRRDARRRALQIRRGTPEAAGEVRKG